MFRRRQKRPPPGEYPASFERAFFRQTLPTTPAAEVRAILAHLRGKGWTEERIAEQILPYLPPPGSPLARDGPAQIDVPAEVSKAWLDRHLPGMEQDQIRLVVDELERRGWPAADAAVAVLPHLLVKLPRPDADAILAGLEDIGVPQADVARLSRTAFAE